MGNIKLKMGYCLDCGNTEPMPIIKDRCQYHYWQGKRKATTPKVGDTFKYGEILVNERGKKYQGEFRITKIVRTPKRPDNRKKETVSELLKLAEIVFNKWIRDRDKNDLFPHYFACISCGLQKPMEQADCGHYVSKMYSSLRFDENNCHAECQKCNREDPNHLVGYRINLINKIGLEKVLELEAVKFASEYKWDKEELLNIIKKYKV